MFFEHNLNLFYGIEFSYGTLEAILHNYKQAKPLWMQNVEH